MSFFSNAPIGARVRSTPDRDAIRRWLEEQLANAQARKDLAGENANKMAAAIAAGQIDILLAARSAFLGTPK